MNRRRVVIAVIAAVLVVVAMPRKASSAPVVWRSALASWYGLYGSKTACGQVRYRGQLGVAHRSLACGTKVRLLYKGRKVTVPVIDRGPFIAQREFDLTDGTRARLRCPDLCSLRWRLP